MRFLFLLLFVIAGSVYAEEGHNWLMLRGMARDHRHWAEFPEIFKAKFQNDRLFFLDAPGFGTEASRASPLTIAEIRSDLRDRWMRLRDQNPGAWSIVALSLGGMVALDWAGAHPDDFSEVIVMNTSAGSLSKWDERLRWSGLKQLISIGATRNIFDREKKIFDLISNRPWTEVTRLIVEDWAKSENEIPADPIQIARQLIAANRFEHPEALHPKLLVLTSTNDHMVNTKASHRIADYYQAPIRIHDTAGHDMTLDAPEWVRDQISQFVSAAR